MRLINY